MFTVHSSLRVRMKTNMEKPDKQILNYLDLSETIPKVFSRQNRKLMRYALICPKSWKNQQLKCHSWNLSRLRYPQGGCHEAAAAMLWEGHSGLAVGWSFSSKILAISQKNSLRRKYCKGELASCLDYLVRAPHMAVGLTHIWKLHDPASTSGLTGRQQAVLMWLFELPTPVLKLASSLVPGMLGEVAGSNK